MMLFLITTLIPVLTLVSATHDNPFRNAEALIEQINSNPNSTWTAGHYFNSKLSRSYLRKLLGTKERSHRHSLPLGKPILDIKDEDIPEKFDARDKWRKCTVIQHIRDQGNCGSCWAVAAASTFSDRLCIASDGKDNINLSAEELTACCKSCGDGCLGGWPEDAWKYFKTNGIVTGGDYDSNEGCQPYSQKPCEHHVKGTRPKCSSLGPIKTPSCEKKCTNKAYKKPFAQDHRKVRTSYSVPADEKSIQKEIMKHGPVEAAFFVFEDFLLYKNGIYQHIAGSYLSGHAVKLIGWGVSKEVKYWLVQNQWNTDWGEKGLFRIRRGNDESGFESRITAGIPIV